TGWRHRGRSGSSATHAGGCTCPHPLPRNVIWITPAILFATCVASETWAAACRSRWPTSSLRRAFDVVNEACSSPQHEPGHEGITRIDLEARARDPVRGACDDRDDHLGCVLEYPGKEARADDRLVDECLPWPELP